MRFIFIAFLALSGCSSVVVSTAAKLMSLDPLSADPTYITVIATMPDGIRPVPNSAKLMFTLLNEPENIDLEETFTLAQTSHAGGVTEFKIADTDINRIIQYQDRARALEKTQPDATSGSISVGIEGCIVGEGPKPDDTFSVSIRLSKDGVALPVIRNAKWSTLLKELDHDDPTEIIDHAC